MDLFPIGCGEWRLHLHWDEGRMSLALAFCVAAILVIGIFSAPWLDWSLAAAASLF